MSSVRQPAVAGTFYPARPQALRDAVAGYLAAAEVTGETPKAVVAPHAGYVYSGPVAASAYVLIPPARQVIRRVVLLGPAHYVAFEGLALPSQDGLATPLGPVAIDPAARATLDHLPQVHVLDEPHEPEHSLEVQLPFLQTVLDDFQVVPLVVGDASPEDVGEVLDRLWGGADTLIVVSSDLSHYHDYQTAQHLDAKTTRAIEQLRVDDLDPACACGVVPLSGLLVAARARRLEVRTLDVRNSGDTAGGRDRVVGYGAYAVG